MQDFHTKFNTYWTLKNHEKQFIVSKGVVHVNFVEKLSSERRLEQNHSSEKQFKCKICHKGFHVPSISGIHENINTTEKSFDCKTCGKWFNVIAQLKHEKIQTGERSLNVRLVEKGSYSQMN